MQDIQIPLVGIYFLLGKGRALDLALPASIPDLQEGHGGEEAWAGPPLRTSPSSPSSFLHAGNEVKASVLHGRRLLAAYTWLLAEISITPGWPNPKSFSLHPCKSILAVQFPTQERAPASSPLVQSVLHGC